MTQPGRAILLAAGVWSVLGASVAGQDQPVDTELIGSWDGFGGSYADIWFDGDYVYLGHFGDAGVNILDISDPTSPQEVAHYRVPPPNGGVSAQDLKVHDGLLFIALEGSNSGDDVLIVDVRDPTQPQELTIVQISGIGSPHDVFYHEGFLYVVDSGSNKVGIVDLTDFDPDDPPPSITTPKWIINNVGNSFVHDITVQQGRLYACAWDSGLWIYDITQVATEMPVFLGSAPGDNTHACWPSADGRFVVTGEERTNGGIKVFEITDQGDSLILTQTDSLVLSDQANSVHNQFMIGNRLYNSWYQAGLQVFDVDPDNGTLRFVASYDTHPSSGGGFAGAWGVHAREADRLIFISDMQTGLYIITIDCNNNGIADTQDIAEGTSEDCNENNVPDVCDLASGHSDDFNENGLPDDCEFGPRIIFVDDDGPLDPGPGDAQISDPAEDGSAQHPFDAIQEAIDDAISRNTIVVADGLYTGPGNGNLNFGGRNLTLRSQRGPGSCILDAGGIQRGFVFENGETEAAGVVGFTITGGVASEDTGGSTGAAILCVGSSPLVSNCIITGNSASTAGGGIACRAGAQPLIRNCTITLNTTGGWGGGVLVSASSPQFDNCTLAGNSADLSGGGVSCSSGSVTSFENSILWGNAAPKGMGGQIALEDVSTLTVTFSDVEGGQDEAFVEDGSTLTWSPGNITADPVFADAPDGDFHLRSSSPCIDGGDPEFEPLPDETDVDGVPRVLCGLVDMGGYELGIGDYDCNQVVDLVDFVQFVACMTGPENGPYQAGCEQFDFEFDGDVDMIDFAGFQRVFTGSNP